MAKLAEFRFTYVVKDSQQKIYIKNLFLYQIMRKPKKWQRLN